MKTLNVFFVIFVLASTGFASTDLANFDDFVLAEDSHFSGNYTVDGDDYSYDTTYINSGGVSLVNHSNGDGWKAWKGFSVSNETHTFADVQPGNEFAQQYSVHADSAHSGDNFGVGYMSGTSLPEMILGSERVVDGLYMTNVTYTAYDMTNGSGFSKAFGDETHPDGPGFPSDPAYGEDWLKVVMEGFDGNGSSTGTEEFYLADFRFADNTEDYILDTWGYVDLTGLGVVKSIVFSLESSDVGGWGINTPTYFAIDTVVPEPCTVALLGLGSLLLRRKRG